VDMYSLLPPLCLTHSTMTSAYLQRTSDARSYDCAFLVTVTDALTGHSQCADILQEGLFFRIDKYRTATGPTSRVPVEGEDAMTGQVGIRADVHTGVQSPNRSASQYPMRRSAAPIKAVCIDHLFLLERRDIRRVYSKMTLFGRQAPRISDAADDHNRFAAGDGGVEGEEGEAGIGRDASSEDHLCVICLSSEKDTIVFPCKHLCLCGTCCLSLSTGSRHLKKCPVCRVHIICMLQLKQ